MPARVYKTDKERKLSRWVLDYFESRSVNGTAALSFFSLT